MRRMEQIRALAKKFDNHSAFRVCLKGRKGIPVFLQEEQDGAYLRDEIKDVIGAAWCDRHTDYRDHFLDDKKQAIAIEECEYQRENETWTLEFTLRILMPFHGLYLYKCLEHAGDYVGLGEQEPFSYHRGRFCVEGMEPLRLP